MEANPKARRIRKFLGLTRTDRHLLIKAALLVGAVRLGLWVLPFRVLRRLVEVRDGKIFELQNSTTRMDRIIWAVKLASQYIPAATCLTQAFASEALLTRNGYPAVLRIGVVKTDEGQLEAHAWVECNGAVVIGNLRDLARYNALPTFQNQVR